jgi:xylulose-5-phosphate/fructose-6-phosphate phosphoketolase
LLNQPSFLSRSKASSPLRHLPSLPVRGARAAYFKQAIHEKLIEHKEYIAEHGDDMPAISGWKWGAKEAAKTRGTSTEGDNV